MTEPWEDPAVRGRGMVEHWRRGGARITRQRRHLLDTLLVADRHLTALEVSDLLHERGVGVDVSTVHRSLIHLHRVGLVHRVTVRGRRGQASHAYRVGGPTEYSAFCTSCESTVPLPGAVALRAARSLARASDFHLSTDAPAFSGHCSACRDGQAPTG